MSLPRISIVTPTFNSVENLEETIESVLGQSYPMLEYIIVDGGSTDGTLEVIRRYESQLALWISEPDRGISDAFNKGIQRSTGDLIGIVNSDDRYEAGAFAAVAQAFDPNDEQVILHGDMCWIDGRGVRDFRPRRWPGAIYYDMPVLHPTCFVSRAVYDRVGMFDLSYQVSMDYDFILRARLSGVRLRYVPHLIAHFRAGGASTQNVRHCHQEVFRSQISHGLNPVVCKTTYCAKTAVNCVKRLPQLLQGKLRAYYAADPLSRHGTTVISVAMSERPEQR